MYHVQNSILYLTKSVSHNLQDLIALYLEYLDHKSRRNTEERSCLFDALLDTEARHTGRVSLLHTLFTHLLGSRSCKCLCKIQLLLDDSHIHNYL